MVKGGKYIIYKEHQADSDNDAIPIVFPKTINHDLIAKTLKITFRDLVIVSAGFVYVSDNILVPYGESHSLNIASRPEDKFLINKNLLEEIVI